MHAQIRYKAAERVRVETVNPAYTSKTCHCCGEQGYRPDQATFKCSTRRVGFRSTKQTLMPRSILQTATSAESHSREHTSGDDSAEEGDVLTVPQDSQADAETQQETLGTYAS